MTQNTRDDRATPDVRSGSYPGMALRRWHSRRAGRRLGLLGLLALLCAGCPADSSDVRPPSDRFYFPTGLATTPDEGTVFVINANADLRFAAGSIVQVNVDVLEAVTDAWTADQTVPGRASGNPATARTGSCSHPVTSRGKVRSSVPEMRTTGSATGTGRPSTVQPTA